MNRRIRTIAAGTSLAVCSMLAVLAMPSQTAYAATATVSFGSTSYTAQSGTQFRVGVYVRSDETPGTYHVELAYDTARLKYVSGADSEKDGIITLEGTATGTEVKYMLFFEAISGGNSGITVSSADVYEKDGVTLMTVSSALAKSPITISGSDTTGAGDYDYAVPEQKTENEQVLVGNVPVLGLAVSADNKDLYIVDMAAWADAGNKLPYETMEGELDGREVLFSCDQSENVRLLYLMDEAEEMTLYACGEDGIFYPCGTEDDVCYASPYAVLSWPADLTEEMIDQRGIVYQIDGAGKGAFVRTDLKELLPWDEEPAPAVEPETEQSSEEEVSTETATETETAAEQKEEAEKPAESEKEISLVAVLYTAAGIFGAILLLLIVVPIIRKSVRKKKAKKYLASLPPEAPWAEKEEELRRADAEGRTKYIKKYVPANSPADAVVREEDLEALAAQENVSAVSDIAEEVADVERPRDEASIIAENMVIQPDPDEMIPEEATILTGIASEVADMKAAMEEPEEEVKPEEEAKPKEEVKPEEEAKPEDEVKPEEEVQTAEILPEKIGQEHVSEEELLEPEEIVIEEDPIFAFDEIAIDDEADDDFLAAFEKSLEEALKDLN